MVQEKSSVEIGPHPANKCAFDASGKMLAVCSEDATIHCFDVSGSEMQAVSLLQGHDDAVQACVFDPANKFLVSCGSDTTFRMWS